MSDVQLITPAYVQKMAAYNTWINGGIYAAAETLSDDQRKRDCGAFFKSIHGTLNHLLWGDQIWMHRFADTPAPASPGIPGSTEQFEAFEALKRERFAFDAVISKWAGEVDQDWLNGTLDWYSGSMKRDMSSPRGMLVTHMFNHQTHHRGQVHCLLTHLGAETPTTDLPFLP